MQKNNTAYISLGSNLGDRKNFLDKALELLAESEDIKLSNVSDTIETKPLASPEHPNYLNAVAQINTTLPPKDLLKKTSEIESALGRKRNEKWSPRTIDLDILLFDDIVLNQPDLKIPHPQLHLRSFALNGLCRLNPDLIHPVLKESVNTLIQRLNGADFLINPKIPQLVSIAGLIGVGKTTLAKKLTNFFCAQTLLEPYDTNPFLPEVYAGKKDLALDSQLFFLTERIKQLNPDTLTTDHVFFSDYIFDKEPIYAKRLLDDRQLEQYKNSYQPSKANIAQPVLVIYLTDSPSQCLNRIHIRNRPYEQKIELEFLNTLDSDYNRLFASWNRCPVIRISNIENYDIDHLAIQVKNYIAVK